MNHKACRQQEELREIKESLERALKDIKGLEEVSLSLRPSERLLAWIDSLRNTIEQLGKQYQETSRRHQGCKCRIAEHTGVNLDNKSEASEHPTDTKR